jgi:hypothetical protein
MKELRQKKSLDIQAKIIGNIVEIKHHLDRVKFFWDRLIHTSKQILDNGEKLQDHNDTVREELLKVSELLNEKIPLLLSEIETDISMYLKPSDGVSKALKRYKDKTANNTMLFVNFMFKDELKKADEVDGLNLETVKEAGNALIKLIKNQPTIF